MDQILDNINAESIYSVDIRNYSHSKILEFKKQLKIEGSELVANEGVAVEGTNEGGYAMQYQKITMPLIKAVQELDAKVVALTTRVSDLE